MPAPAIRTLNFGICGPIARDDLPGLTHRVCELFSAHEPREAVIDVAGVEADAVTVDALARLALVAQRYSCELQLQRASPSLCALVALMGLDDVLR